jgi:flagellar biosynthetic protein FlhB
MSDAHEKTEEPTAKRLEEAREKGQIARSKELATALLLAVSALTLLVIGQWTAEAMFNLTERIFVLSRDETYDANHMFQILGYAIESVSASVLIFMIVVAIAGFYGEIALGGFNFSWKSASPQANKLNPLNGFKRMFGVNGLVELLKAIAKVVVVAVAVLLTLNFYRDEALHLDMELYPLNLFHAMDMIGWAFVILCLSLIPIAFIDVPYQRHRHNEEMKMTKQEVKDERKNTEGNPEVKGRIRRLQYQSAASRMMQEVPEADVVVTNPTHYSVALKYDQEGTGAPVMVAKGADELALHIRKIAHAHDVPVLESPMLARAIYYSTEASQEIPEKLFMAVAQVLAYVYQLKAFRKGKGKRPAPLSNDLPIPPELRR